MSLDSKSHIPPRRSANAELTELLAEIAEWDDDMLLHMHRRFSESRLFRVHHDPEGPLTPRAERLLEQARTEIARRGLSPADNGD